MSESKTARASAVKVVKEKKIISDEEYVRLLRIDVASGLYPNSEGTKALLRLYDEALANIAEECRIDAAAEQLAGEDI